MSSSQVQETLALLEPLIRDLPPKMVITPGDPSYALHAEPYAIQKDLHPSVVFIPDSTTTLASIVSFLYKTKLDFNIRGHGFKSPSARDVIISMIGFNGFGYDSALKVATIGVGATWIEVAKYMEKVDPEYSIAVARTPATGVGGVILNGGFSWMSTEFGCISDPINFLDAEVVKYDGTVVMASQEPDLLWALRGSGGGFGVMTKIVMQAHRYPTDIWSGMILVPRKSLPELARDIDQFVNSSPDPKINFFLFLLPRILLPTVLDDENPGTDDIVVLYVYDALGEVHGRNAFRWALEKPGAIDQTKVANMRGVVNMQRNAALLRGTMKTLYAPMGVEKLPEKTMLRAIDWYDSLASWDKAIQDKSLIAFEFLTNRPPIGGTAAVAWPRKPHFNHLILVVASCSGDGSTEQEETLRQIVIDAPIKILGENAANIAVNPAGLEPYHDIKAVYGEHYEKLVSLRTKYDPERRFKAFM